MTQDKGTGTGVSKGGLDVAVVSPGPGFRAVAVVLSLAMVASGDGRRTLVVAWGDGDTALLCPPDELGSGVRDAYGTGIIDEAVLPVVPFQGFGLLRLDDALVEVARLPELQRRLGQEYGLVLHLPNVHSSGAEACLVSSSLTRQSEFLVVVAGQTFPIVTAAVNIIRAAGAQEHAVLVLDRYDPAAKPSLDEIGKLLTGTPVVPLPARPAVASGGQDDGLPEADRPESADYLAGIRELLAVLDAG